MVLDHRGLRCEVKFAGMQIDFCDLGFSARHYSDFR